MLVATGLAIVGLTWTSSSLGGASIRGYEIGIGLVSLIVIAATIVLVHLQLKPAWTGAGFVFAALAKELIDALDMSGVKPGAGLWIATGGALAAALLLVVDMFASVGQDP